VNPSPAPFFPHAAFGFLVRLPWTLVIAALLAFATSERAAAAAPDLIVTGGRIVLADERGTVAEAMAIGGGKVVAVGTAREIVALAGPGTRTENLQGRTVLPGLVEAHVHALRASLASLRDPYAELRSIGEIQAWVRERAKVVPAGQWIRIPRNEITRISERRHPTVAELDAACATHPVVFEAVRKYVFNSAGWRELGLAAGAPDAADARVVRDAAGQPRFLITTSPRLTSRFASTAAPTAAEKEAALLQLHANYHAAGITTILERGSRLEEYREYEALERAGKLGVRTRFTLSMPFRSGAEVRKFVADHGLKPGAGSDWLAIRTLKIVADGGIHWGNTYLSEPYGPKRIAFYGHEDPSYRGDLVVPAAVMQDVFTAAAQLGWQMIVHVTGDAGTDVVLSAMEATHRTVPLTGRRFLLTHSYFPTPVLAQRAAALGLGVDTQVFTYHLDAPVIHDVYGSDWAARFIGVGTWRRAGVPVVISSDHMVGYDRNHGMNAYNPFIALQAAIDRRDETGRVHGADQKLTRIEALRAFTYAPAWCNFEEDRAGTLEPGKHADFIVIDRDYLTCPVEQIRDTQVLRTVIAGKTVFAR
jgi:hypothetical protein